MALQIRAMEPADVAGWEHQVMLREGTTYVDSWRWRRALEEVHPLRHYWFQAHEGDRAEGLLALTLTRHPLFGPYLVTAPFGSHGGFFADSETAFHGLLRTARDLRRQLKARFVQIRVPADVSPWRPETGWTRSDLYATYRLPLADDLQELLEARLSPKRRWEVRKALAGDFVFRFGGEELLEDFWWVMCRAMKELGSPYHPQAHVAAVLRAFGEDARLGVAFTATGERLGAALVMFHGKEAGLVHANFLRAFRGRLAGEFLYWSVISECCKRGVRSLDLGRSLVGSGNEFFKMKWNPERVPLAYWHDLRKDAAVPALNQQNARFGLAIAAWRRLPLAVQGFLGPRLISGIL